MPRPPRATAASASDEATAPHPSPLWSAENAPAAGRCAWCTASFGPDATRLRGRIRCAHCGTATTSPWPTDGELDAAYGDWYRPSGGRFGTVGDAVLRRTRARLARRIDRAAPAGPVLDVGAGDGTLVDALVRRGREALGLERQARGEHIRAGDVTSVAGEWSAIVLWHSLEHLRDPVGTLRAAVDLLQPEGLLVLALPNGGSLQALAFRDRWLALDLPRHLVHVSSPTLLATLRHLGLRVERVSHLRGGQVGFGWAHGLVGWLPGHPDLYDAIRGPAARARPMSSGQRVMTLAAGALLSPVAALGTLAEALSRRGGTVYVEARK